LRPTTGNLMVRPVSSGSKPLGASLAFRTMRCFLQQLLEIQLSKLLNGLFFSSTTEVLLLTTLRLAPALERIRDRELGQRIAFVNYYKEILDRLGPQDGGDKASPSDNDQPDQPWLVPEKDDHDVPEEEYICCYCKAFTYLTRIKCNETSKVLCLSHYHTYDCCRPADTEDQHKLQLMQNTHTYRARYTDQALSSLVQKVVDRAHVPEVWAEKVERALEDTARPSLKLLRSLLSEGDRIPYDLPQFSSLKAFVDRCNDWVEEATNYITRKQQNRRKNEKAWRKGNSAKAAELEERDRELRKIENIVKLLAEADEISFDCPEIDQLRQRADAIADFQKNARGALNSPGMLTTQEFEDLMEMGKSYNVDIPELEQLDKFVHQLKWIDRARECRGTFLTLKDVGDLIQQGIDLGITDTNEHLAYFQEQKQAGDLWEAKAKELMSVDAVHYQQLEALSGQASTLPVSRETLAQVDQILNKQREAHRQIVSLYERSKEPEFRKRPKYKDVREVMDALTELQSKPTGTIDLEKEQKRHEDWMRKGKKLFGKANAPLHILLMHMTYVEQRNIACFDLKDRPRTPVEPASREPTPDHSRSGSELDSSRRAREVFCICRQPEAGMMIECEICHEW
jgi:[histone H3]-trimethyl-L-lysine4 demethylase